MNKETKLKNLSDMIPKLNDLNLASIYDLVWSLTVKDLLYKNAQDKIKELEEIKEFNFKSRK